MFQNKRNLFLITLTGYLCLFMIVLPCRLEGALLKSKIAPSISVDRVIIERFIELGMDRKDAVERVALLRQAGIQLNKDFIFAGGEPPADYDPPMNNIGLVFLFLGVAVGIGIYAGLRTK